MGLRIMQSRIGMIGGTLTIERHAGGGTSVICAAPQKSVETRMAAKTKTPAKRLLIVDDHPMMRTGLAQLIDNEPDLKVCAEADTAGQAINAGRQTEIRPRAGGHFAAGQKRAGTHQGLRTLKPELPILVVSMHDEMIYAERVLRAGGARLHHETGRRAKISARHPAGAGGPDFCQRKNVGAHSGNFFRPAQRSIPVPRCGNFPTASLRCFN